MIEKTVLLDPMADVHAAHIEQIASGTVAGVSQADFKNTRPT